MSKVLSACLLTAGFCFAACCPHIDAAGLTRIERTKPAKETTEERPNAAARQAESAVSPEPSRTVIGRLTGPSRRQVRRPDAGSTNVPEGLLEILPRLTAALEVIQQERTEAGIDKVAAPRPAAQSQQPSRPRQARTVIGARSHKHVQRQAETELPQETTPIGTVTPDTTAETTSSTTARAAASTARATIGPDHRIATLRRAGPSEQALVEAGPIVLEQGQGPTTDEPAPAVTEPEQPPAQRAALFLTPATAAHLALRNSLDLQTAAARIREAEAQLRQAFGLDDFRLTASGTYGRRGPIATLSMPGEGDEVRQIEMGDPEIRQQNLQLVKPLYTENRIKHTQKLASHRLEAQRLNRIAAKRQIDLSARNVTYQVLRAEQLVMVAEDRAEAMAAHLEDTKQFKDAGLVPQFEVVQAETALAEARGQVITARTTAHNVKAALRRLLTLDQNRPIELQEGEKPELPQGSRTDFIQQAWELRPEMDVARQGVRLAELNVGLAADSDNVSVNLVGGLTHTKETFGSEPWSWQVALQAEKPLIDANEKETEVAKAKAQLDAARIEVEKLKQQIALEVTQAQLGVDDAQQRLQVAKQGVVEARERIRLAKVRYENEVSAGIEVLDAQAALTAARVELVNASYSLRSAITELKSSMGLWQESD